MLDVETKRRIDTARDILVGKVPDPKSQVEQITIALIYKFMDDLDAESEELGGQRKFFADGFAHYGWAKLMHPGLGGHETLNLYAEAITRMPENPGIPPLFREIFNNAYLPYRDPVTLRDFLKIIDGFTYDHSERLGDAFEYLLSVLGSQGDAGQFRTPRHIIDFMVAVVDPKKEDVVLDPACGTAGFLISSYKHILAANTLPDGNSELMPDDRGRLAVNFKGYDISPDMVRLSLVNMYLHDFVAPQIFEYDTLTSDERWNEYADVILANPPFMSPKGGIRPHNRFSVQAKRSEVLFVDYMAEHLTPTGRAGIIVPEGIIFQSQNAHKQLRKMLVEDYLVAVVSLPAGVFNPYSGVKTSILILDKALARRADHIAFFKVERDGFDLGAQRRPIEANDLPQVQAELTAYLSGLHDLGRSLDGFQSALGLAIRKENIAADGEFNLSGERYRIISAGGNQWGTVTVDQVCNINPKNGDPSQLYPESYFNYIDISCIENETGRFLGANRVITNDAPSRARRLVEPGDTLVATVRPNLRAFTLLSEVPDRAIASTGFAVLRAKTELLLPGFLIYLIRDDAVVAQMIGLMGRGSYPSINQADVASIRLPLPPLHVQKEIVAEIEGYQKVIDGARAVVENYRPRIAIDPEWPMVAIGEICDLVNGRAFKPAEWEDLDSGGLPIVRIQNLNNPDNGFNFYTGQVKSQHVIEHGELLFSWSGSRGTSFGAHIWKGETAVLNQHIFKVCFDEAHATKKYLLHILNRAVSQVEENLHGGVGLVHITKGDLERIHIPLPELATQQGLVSEIEAEQAIVDANRELIHRFEKKIQDVIGKVWGEGAC